MNDLERDLREQLAREEAAARTRRAGTAAEGFSPVEFSRFDAELVASLHGYARPKRSGYKRPYPWGER